MGTYHKAFWASEGTGRSRRNRLQTSYRESRLHGLPKHLDAH